MVLNQVNFLILLCFIFLSTPIEASTLRLSDLSNSSNNDLVIPLNTTVIINKNINVRHLVIKGQLKCPANTRTYIIAAQAISVTGRFQCGSTSSPFQGQLHLRLKDGLAITGPHGTMGKRGFFVLSGGQVHFFGQKKNTNQVKLRATAQRNQRYIEVTSPVGWSIGDRIAITSTGFDMNEAERLITENISSDRKRIFLTSALRFRHYGVAKKYMANDKSWLLDERARVVNLNRNIKIYPYGGDFSTTKLGAHMMVMRGGKAYIDSVEFRYMGRQGNMASYPFHWHMLGNANGQFIRNSSIYDSFQRCVTIHGTNNTTVQNNICYNHYGHGFFLESGSETGNLIKGNIGFVTKRISREKSLLISDVTGKKRRFPAPATYWISNPNNTVVNNVAAGSFGTGFWMAFEDRVICNMDSCSRPVTTNTLSFNNNIAHSSKVGITWDGAPGSRILDNPNNPDDRALENAHYRPSVKPVFKNLVAYKNFEAGIYFRGNAASFENAVLADNGWSLFLAYSQHFKNSAIIGKSRNFTNRDLNIFSQPDTDSLAGIVLYDGPFELEDVAFFDFPTTNETYNGKSVTPTPFMLIGGANKFENKVKGLSFNPQPWRKVNFNRFRQLADWRDAGYSTSLRDLDGTLTGRAGSVVVPAHEFNNHGTCSLKPAWSARVCKYNLGLYRILTGISGNNTVYFDIKNPRGVFIASEQRRMQNKFNTIIGDPGIYEVTPRGTFANVNQFTVDLQTENQRSAPVVRFKNVGTCRVEQLARRSSLANLKASAEGFFTTSNDLYVKLKSSKMYPTHIKSELSQSYFDRKIVKCD